MKDFSYARVIDSGQAIELVSQNGAKFLGGGTNLVDLMRENIERPETLIDVTGLPDEIQVFGDGRIRISAAVKNTALANHPVIREKFPVLSQAILFGASGQIRNMATVGGNMLQRTRCGYFYDVEGSRCNKRKPGSGCDAMDGFNRNHAILGWSDQCIAVFPSDMCVALAALDTTVHTEGKNGLRQIAFQDFHLLPGDTPQIENELQPGELITAIDIGELPAAKNSMYRKVRDRASYAFALVSAAVILETKNGMIENVRIALGGVAHKPWRAAVAENFLYGVPATDANFAAAADMELKVARGFEHNTFKIELAKRVIVSTLRELVSGAEASS